AENQRAFVPGQPHAVLGTDVGVELVVRRVSLGDSPGPEIAVAPARSAPPDVLERARALVDIGEVEEALHDVHLFRIAVPALRLDPLALGEGHRVPVVDAGE